MDLASTTVESLFTLKHRLLHFITHNHTTQTEIYHRDDQLNQQSLEMAQLKQRLAALEQDNARLALQLQQSNTNHYVHTEPSEQRSSDLDYNRLKEQLDIMKTALCHHKAATAALATENQRLQRDYDLLKVSHEYISAKYNNLEASTGQAVDEATTVIQSKAASVDTITQEFQHFLTLYQDSVIMTTKDMGHLHTNISQLNGVIESMLRAQLRDERELFKLRAALAEKTSIIQDLSHSNNSLTSRHEHFTKQYKQTLGLLQSNILLGLQHWPQPPPQTNNLLSVLPQHEPERQHLPQQCNSSPIHFPPLLPKQELPNDDHHSSNPLLPMQGTPISAAIAPSSSQQHANSTSEPDNPPLLHEQVDAVSPTTALQDPCLVSATPDQVLLHCIPSPPVPSSRPPCSTMMDDSNCPLSIAENLHMVTSSSDSLHAASKASPNATITSPLSPASKSPLPSLSSPSAIQHNKETSMVVVSPNNSELAMLTATMAHDHGDEERRDTDNSC